MSNENNKLSEKRSISDEKDFEDKQTDSDDTLRQLKSIQTLVTVAAISGPVSLLIGGVLLAGIAVIAGVLALVKVSKLNQKPASEYSDLVLKVKRSALVALTISAAALVLNIYALATIMPAVLDALETGDASSLLQDVYGSSSADPDSEPGSAAQGSSIWG